MRSANRGQAATPSTIWVNPSFTYFFAEQLSLRVDVGLAYEDRTSYDYTLVSAGAHAGYNVPLASWLSVWPQLGLAGSYYHAEEALPLATANGRPPATTDATYVDLRIESPLVFFPAPHFFVGAGPRLSIPVSASERRGPVIAGVAADVTQRTFGVGGAILLGGWF